MSILGGHKRYERYILTDSGYQLCSMKTYADSVHFSDESTAQNNLGAIKGITDSLTATSSNVALSAAAGNNLQTQVSELNSNLNSYGSCVYIARTTAEGGVGVWQFYDVPSLSQFRYIALVKADANFSVRDIVQVPLTMFLNLNNVERTLGVSEEAGVWIYACCINNTRVGVYCNSGIYRAELWGIK